MAYLARAQLVLLREESSGDVSHASDISCLFSLRSLDKNISLDFQFFSSAILGLQVLQQPYCPATSTDEFQNDFPRPYGQKINSQQTIERGPTPDSSATPSIYLVAANLRKMSLRNKPRFSEIFLPYTFSHGLYIVKILCLTFNAFRRQFVINT